MNNIFLPQWVLDSESDEKIYKKKRLVFFTLIIVLYFGSLLSLNYFNSEIRPYIFFFVIIAVILLTFALFGATRPVLPNLLSANLYRIGLELESFDVNSLSYIKRNQNYLKNCQRIIEVLNSLVKETYFVQNYFEFLDKLEELLLRLNSFYVESSQPATLTNLSENIKKLAEIIHRNHINLTAEHTELIDELLSELRNTTEPVSLKTFILKKWYKSLNSIWYNLPYSFRVILVLITIGVIVFVTSTWVMIYLLNIDKSQAYSIAFGGCFLIVATLISQIDKIVRKEEIKIKMI